MSRPDVPVFVPAQPSAADQEAGIQELIRIAELQKQGYTARPTARPFRLRDVVPGPRRPVDEETFGW